MVFYGFWASTHTPASLSMYHLCDQVGANIYGRQHRLNVMQHNLRFDQVHDLRTSTAPHRPMMPAWGSCPASPWEVFDTTHVNPAEAR